jgi:hypothetical protein
LKRQLFEIKRFKINNQILNNKMKGNSSLGGSIQKLIDCLYSFEKIGRRPLRSDRHLLQPLDEHLGDLASGDSADEFPWAGPLIEDHVGVEPEPECGR